MSRDQPRDPSQRCCANCKHLLWAVAIGQGARCVHPLNENKNLSEPDQPAAHRMPVIPSREFVCAYFEKHDEPRYI